MEIWKRGIHVGLTGGVETEGDGREVRSASGGEEEDEVVARGYHNSVLSGKLRQAVHQ